MESSELFFDEMGSPLGDLELFADNAGLVSVSFLDNKKEREQKCSSNKILDETKVQLNAYFEGKLKAFTVALSLEGTEFQKKVWNELLKIPFGKTISYLDLAKKLGDEKCIRAAASANGKNPVAIIIPCHRVIGTDGKLVGYAGKLWRKKRLLEIESNQERLF
jgi:methylated-DNA-[protein]-cysteine S-methyltransferase